jgi:hypothetical protein
MIKRLSVLVLAAASVVYGAAFNATARWNVHPAGAGSADTNGGAFDPGVSSPGTDESLADAGTAITVTSGGTTGTASPAFSATTHGPGNFIHIASGSGCTPGWYEILSQSAGTATFNVTMGSGTCVGVIGGALATPAIAASLIVGCADRNLRSISEHGERGRWLPLYNCGWHGYRSHRLGGISNDLW